MDHDAYVQFMWDACTLVLRHGKTPIVWEEAGVAKLPEGTLVQHWSDAAPAREAASRGQALIMSPAPHAYLDQKYDESTELGLTWAGAVEVRDAYEWDPSSVIEGADVLGVEAALWSETTETMADVEQLVFPRLPAVAEVGWSRRTTGRTSGALGRPRRTARAARRELPPLQADRLATAAGRPLWRSAPCGRARYSAISGVGP